MQIQAILRDELKESTVITIAHRLEAVKDADFFIRLEEGKVVDCGPAAAGGEGGANSLGDRWDGMES